MKINSYRTRSVVFAYLIGPPRYLDRPMGSDIHNKVCEDLALDDIAFRYSPGPGAMGEEGSSASRGFQIQMERPSGRGGLKIQIDNTGVKNTVRILLQYAFPPATTLRNQEIDTAIGAIFEVLGGGWQTAGAEVRIRAQVEAEEGSALTFFREKVMNFRAGALDTLEAEPNYYAVKFATPAGDPSDVDQLRQPKRDVSLEVLREDRSNVFIESVSTWQQLAAQPGQGEGEGTTVDMRRLRSFERKPSVYIENAEMFVEQVVLDLFA